jgi:hypothetical protein
MQWSPIFKPVRAFATRLEEAHLQTPNLQERFALSDDVAECIRREGELDSVDASACGFGELIELLLLKRPAPERLRIRDGSQRGERFRSLLSSDRVFSWSDTLGLYHAPPGRASLATEANDFADHARVALRDAGMVSQAATRLSGALHELLGNVDEHAGSNATCIAGYSLEEDGAWVCVADTGDGVLSGYQSAPLTDKPEDACEALRWAVLKHRSRTGDPGRGTGFRTVVNALRSLDGSLRVRSDDASLELVQQGSDVRSVVREQGNLFGFVVSMHVRWAGP